MRATVPAVFALSSYHSRLWLCIVLSASFAKPVLRDFFFKP